MDEATDYGLDGPGIESRWGGEIFLTTPDRLWGPPAPAVQWALDLFPRCRGAWAWR